MIALVLFLHEARRLLYKHLFATLSSSETLKIPTQTDTIVTVSNQSNHEAREAASSLWPISASVIQQSPGTTLEPVGEGIFFLWRLVQSHPIRWTTLEQYAHETPLCTWFQKVFVILARIFEYNRLWRLLLKTYFIQVFTTLMVLSKVLCFICIIFLWSHTFENRNLKHGLI